MTEHPDRYPGYDVMSKRDGMSWNDATRQAIDHRLAVPKEPRFFNADEWRTLGAVCGRIMPQPATRPPVPLPAYVDVRLVEGRKDGYRFASMPDEKEAWRIGLRALEADSHGRHGAPFAALDPADQDALLRDMQQGKLDGPHWEGMPSREFFKRRVIPDITHAYYAHPTSWNEIGYGGPASPRGYVRMGLNRRDPWEAAEAHPGEEARARRLNKHVR